MKDNVNNPEHYTYGKFECIEVIHELTQDLAGIQAFALGNTIKYLWRFTRKNGVEDLEKAKWYLEGLIKEFKEPKENDSKPKEMDTEPKEDYRVSIGELSKALDPISNAFIPKPEQLNPFHDSNCYVYRENSEYLGDATNPNVCVAASKPNPNYAHKTTARPIYQLDNDLNVIKKYESIHAAVRDLKNNGVGYAVRHGTRCNGYLWKYAD